LTPNRVAGLLIGFAGAAIVVVPSAAAGAGDGGQLPAELAIITAAMLTAVSTIVGRRFRAMPAIVPAAGQATMSTLLLLPIALFLETPWRDGVPSAGALAAIGGLGVLCSSIAMIVYYQLLRTAGAANASLVAFLIPVATLALGRLALDDGVTGRQFAGMLTILAGLAVIDGRLWPSLARMLSPEPLPTYFASRT
jgi:drug/metabolite transporter (DMT)-like permease